MLTVTKNCQQAGNFDFQIKDINPLNSFLLGVLYDTSIVASRMAARLSV